MMIVMGWIKNKVGGWSGKKSVIDVDVFESNDTPRYNDSPNFYQRNPQHTFRVYNATGGMIIETSRWNPTAGEWETEMTVIHNDSTEQVTNDIAKIITLESLKK